MAVIRFEHVSKYYSGAAAAAVADCTFDVADGSLVVLLGPSGCGKTTLLKMVNRLVEPDVGAVYLDGQEVRELEINILRRQIGYVIQQVGLFPHMTVAQNISVVPELLGWPRERIQRRVDELLDLVQLPPDEFRGRYPHQLSGGQQQRVGVARGLAGEPKVILMDEPFGAIDAITRAGLQRELMRLQRKLKKTILFVTHDVEEALFLSDKIVVMQQGKIVQYDSPVNLLTQPANEFVYQLMGAEDIVRQLSQVRVETAMQPLQEGWRGVNLPTISCEADLRSALSILLRTGAPALLVVDPALNGALPDLHPEADSGMSHPAAQPVAGGAGKRQNQVGLLTLDNIRASAEEQGA